jgi:hypothetical protein
MSTGFSQRVNSDVNTFLQYVAETDLTKQAHVCRKYYHFTDADSALAILKERRLGSPTLSGLVWNSLSINKNLIWGTEDSYRTGMVVFVFDAAKVRATYGSKIDYSMLSGEMHEPGEDEVRVHSYVDLKYCTQIGIFTKPPAKGDNQPLPPTRRVNAIKKAAANIPVVAWN